MVGELIYICGPDGVGKSTQVQLLIENLKKEGKVFEYRWLRFHHLFSLPLLGIARLMGLSEVQTLDDGEKIGYHYFYKSKIISSLYPSLLFLDTLIFTIAKIYVPMKFFRKNVICDRFIYDTMVDITISTGKNTFFYSKLGLHYLKLIPKNTQTVMLLADCDILKSRRNDVKFDKTLERKVFLYWKFSNCFDISIIDGSLSIDNIQKEIFTNLKNGSYGF